MQRSVDNLLTDKEIEKLTDNGEIPRKEFFYNLLEDCFAPRDKENSNRS